jgi:hypothetical protein
LVKIINTANQGDTAIAGDLLTPTVRRALLVSDSTAVTDSSVPVTIFKANVFDSIGSSDYFGEYQKDEDGNYLIDENGDRILA